MLPTEPSTSLSRPSSAALSPPAPASASPPVAPRVGLPRRRLIVGAASASVLAACTGVRPAFGDAAAPAIVFVHGDGDTAGLWMTTFWRFETNGWPRDRLHAVDFPYPRARDDDTKPQEGRSSAAESAAFLAAEIDRVLQATGTRQVVLMASSRGGNAVRSVIARGGAAWVSHAILCGTPNHGVWADIGRLPNNEFNGAGPFLAALNTPQGPAGDEVSAGIRWLTIRSDNNDKYAQPDGVWIGQKGLPTHVAYDGPALRGAENVVIAGADHREVAFGRQAFAEAFRFITGKPPVALDIEPEAEVVLSGKVSGYGADNLRGNAPSNLPLVGATIAVYATDPSTGERLGAPRHQRTVGSDGLWGPLRGDSRTAWEFVIAAPGYATTHLYRSPFARSSSIVNLRAERIAEADRGAAAIVVFSRPRGYFGVPRDQIALDGKSPPAGVPPGVAGVSMATLKLADATPRPVVASFNAERIVGRTWPAAGNETTVLELHY